MSKASITSNHPILWWHQVWYFISKKNSQSFECSNHFNFWRRLLPSRRAISNLTRPKEHQPTSQTCLSALRPQQVHHIDSVPRRWEHCCGVRSWNATRNQEQYTLEVASFVHLFSRFLSTGTGSNMFLVYKSEITRSLQHPIYLFYSLETANKLRTFDSSNCKASDYHVMPCTTYMKWPLTCQTLYTQSTPIQIWSVFLGGGLYLMRWTEFSCLIHHHPSYSPMTPHSSWVTSTSQFSASVTHTFQGGSCHSCCVAPTWEEVPKSSCETIQHMP